MNWAKQNGVCYQKGAAVVLGKDVNEDLATFGQIISVFVVQSTIVMELKLFKIQGFNDHFHSVIVQETQKPHVLSVTSDMFDHHLYGLYLPPIIRNDFSVNEKKHIVMKYKICYS